MMNRFTIKKRMVLLVLLMVAALGVHAEENVILRLNTTGGQQYDFLLAGQQPEIVCRNSVMTVSYHEQDAPEKTVTLSFSRDEVDNLCFVSKTVDAIDQVSQQQRIGFNLSQSGQLLITGLTATDRVRVFTADGQQVPVEVSRQSGSAIVSFDGQRSGLFVVSVNNQYSFKLMKP